MLEKQGIPKRFCQKLRKLTRVCRPVSKAIVVENRPPTGSYYSRTFYSSVPIRFDAVVDVLNTLFTRHLMTSPSLQCSKQTTWPLHMMARLPPLPTLIAFTGCGRSWLSFGVMLTTHWVA